MQAAAPYLTRDGSVARVMRRVIYALLPGMAAYLYVFGWGVAVNILLAVAGALLFEGLMLQIRGVAVRPFLGDGSALLTALLLALSLPPMLPWWLPVLGSFIAIVVAKQLYGGLGYNPFNPAMAAFAVLLIAFPLEMSLWPLPLDLLDGKIGFLDAWRYSLGGQLPGGVSFDAISAATPLDRMRTDLALGHNAEEIRQAGVFGHWAGRGMEWVSLAYLVGGLLLMAWRIITWQIPLALLTMLAVCAGIGYWLAPGQSIDPQLHLLGGATLLGAFFIATDPVTAATAPLGKLIYGAGIGGLIYAIRTWGGYPDGVAFAVLLMGMCVPLLDQYALPRVFGARRGGSHAR